MAKAGVTALHDQRLSVGSTASPHAIVATEHIKADSKVSRVGVRVASAFHSDRRSS